MVRAVRVRPAMGTTIGSRPSRRASSAVSAPGGPPSGSSASAGSPSPARARATLTPLPPARSTARAARSVSIGTFRSTKSDLSRHGFKVTVRIMSDPDESCYNEAWQGSEAMLAAIAQFRDYLQVSRRLSPHTLKSYSEDLLQFLNFLTRDGFSCVGWEAVDHRLVRGFLVRLQEEGLARRSVARKLSAVRSFYRYLRRQGAVERDPTVGVTGPKQERRLPSHLLAPEMEAFLLAPDRSDPRGLRDAALLECLYSSGMRVSELVSLNVADLPQHGDSLTVVGKRQKERLVFLGRSARETLADYLALSRPRLFA